MRRFLLMVVISLTMACNFKSSVNGGSTSPSGPISGDSAGGMASNERAAMIDVMGKTLDEARAALRAAGFTGEVEVNRIALECVDAKQVPGQINCQRPDIGQLHYRHAAVHVHVYEAPTHHGRITVPQMDKARGMKIEEAKAYFRSLGHVGPFEVREDTVDHHKGCAVDTVCETGPSGVGVSGTIYLVINQKTVDITLPD